MKISRARHALAGAAAATCILSHHERAHAWDSQQDGQTPIIREQNWAPTFLTRGQFGMHVLKDAIGSHVDGSGNRIEKLLRCRSSIILPNGTVNPDCELASRLDVDHAKAGWLTARVGGDVLAAVSRHDGGTLRRVVVSLFYGGIFAASCTVQVLLARFYHSLHADLEKLGQARTREQPTDDGCPTSKSHKS